MATSSTSNFATAGKAASNLTRALQNVRYIPFIFSHLNAILYFIGDPHMRVSYVPGGGAHGDRGHCPVSIASDVGSRLGMRGAGHINKLLAQSVFGLWMTSALLEMQLKAHHCPYIVRVAWPNLLQKFSNSSPSDRKFDEPMIVLKRNVFFSKRDEEKIK